MALPLRWAATKPLPCSPTQQPQSRAHLATLLWPDDGESTALGYLRHTLWTLTQALGKEWFVCTRTSLALSPQPTLWVDVDLLQASVTNPHAAPTMALTQAVTLYRGDFLTGLAVAQAPAFEEWQRQQSERLRALQIAALRQIVHRQLAQDNVTAALATTEQWLALDPLDEAAHVQLMKLYAGTRQRVRALRQYARCVQILQREVGASPLPSTTTLYHALQQADAPWHSTLPTPAWVHTPAEQRRQITPRPAGGISRPLGAASVYRHDRWRGAIAARSGACLWCTAV